MTTENRITPRSILLLICIILNVLAAFAVSKAGFKPVEFSELGLAFGFAAFLV